MKTKNDGKIRCCECGKFCKPYDRGTYYGSPLSIDPPEEEIFCKKCSKKLEQYYLSKKWVPDIYWLKPHWIFKVVSKLNERLPEGCVKC